MDMTVRREAPKKRVMVFRRVSGREGLAGIRDDWEQVLVRMERKRYFHYYQWYDAYINALDNDPSAMHFFLACEDNTPVAVFPLKRSSRRIGGLSLKVLELPRHSHMPLRGVPYASYAEHTDLLSEFTRYLRRQREVAWDVLCFGNLLEDSCVLGCMSGLSGVLTVVKRTSRCDYLCCDDYGDRFSKFSKKFRQNLRTARNHLGKIEGVRFASSREQPELEGSFESFLTVEASGWKGDKGAGTAIEISPTLKDFYFRLLHGFADLGGCEVHTLKVADECLAGYFCLRVGDTSYVLKIGHNEQYRKLSPGNMLLEWLLEKYSDDPEVRFLNFVNAVEWLKKWRPSAYDLQQIASRRLGSLALKGSYGIGGVLQAFAAVIRTGRCGRVMTKTRLNAGQEDASSST